MITKQQMREQIRTLNYDIKDLREQNDNKRSVIRDLKNIIAILSTKIDLSNEEFLRYRIITYLNPDELNRKENQND